VAVQPLVGARRAVGEHGRLAGGTEPRSDDHDGARPHAPLERLDGKLVKGVLTVTASERRSQRQNREAAMKRMAEILAEAIAPPPKKRRPMRVSRGADEKRLAEKHRRAEIKRLRRPDDD